MPAPEKENEKDPSAALGMTKRRGLPHFFSSRLGSQPPPLRGTSFRGKEGVCRLLASSFRAKARNLFRSRSGKRGEERDHGKHRTLCGVESRCFMQTALRRKTETANEKDPSTALGMTIRERAVSHSLSSRGGSEPPPLRTASFQGEGGSVPPSRIVISSESEKSFSFAVRKAL